MIVITIKVVGTWKLCTFWHPDRCAMPSNFFINCSTGEPILGENLLVTKISIQNHEIGIEAYAGRSCYDQDGQLIYENRPTLTLPFYAISSSKNNFIVVGCDSYAYLLGSYQNDNNNYSTGCTTTCTSMERVSANGTCSGIGCCQTDIPAGLQNTEIQTYSFTNHTDVMHFNPCSYAFDVEQDRFNFSQAFLANFTPETQPLVLEWAIDNDTCGGNATAHNLDDLSGYYCTCNHGYSGNPYLSNSCTGIYF
ncbi:wall-associated receptor kinase 2-like [Ziziphus jujuba]|uniref:Wall-associated receptor kinase 2-like n=1 Tax=Ziziphus jujuba TaxID=326968 RepID=A0ABM3I5K6_ZIZJJ|nr:wall-associated receptor kinase 2-like [Ziziphus jujuba]